MLKVLHLALRLSMMFQHCSADWLEGIPIAGLSLFNYGHVYRYAVESLRTLSGEKNYNG